MIQKTRQLLLTLILLVCVAGLFAQSIEKTLVRSFNLQGLQAVALQLDAPVQVNSWNQSIFRVQMTVTLDRGSEAMLRSLVQAGRYNLHSIEEDGTFVINAPGLDREILVNGHPLAEHITFEVFAPENVEVEIETSTSASTDHFTDF